MHERFSDPVKAACYVGSGLKPNTTYSVTLRSGGRVRQQICSSKETVRAIEIFCRKFPMTSVLFFPEPVNGLVAELRCHCDEGRKLTCCGHDGTRPHVYVRLAETDDAVGSGSETHSPARIAM